MKKLIILLVLIGIAGNVLGGVYGGGSGTEEEPYLISDPNHMQEIGANVGDWGSYFLLTNDIDLSRFSGTEFNIIGDWSNPFKGVFNGNGHSISNFSYDTFGGSGVELDGIGIFKNVKGDPGDPAEIKNLELIDPNVVSDGRSIGTLIGSIGIGDVIIENCYSFNASVIGDEYVGGLIGAIENGYTHITSHCGTTGKVKGNESVGGLVGYLYLSTILKSWANCNVEGVNLVGGLVGYDLESTIADSWSSGTVTGGDRVGGLVGYAPEFYTMPTIRNCYSTSIVTGNSVVGGFIGYVNGIIANCFWNRSINPYLDGIGNASDPNVIGKTTSELKQPSTFTNWDFIETWGIEDNQTYPFLKLIYPVGDLDLSKDVNLVDLSIFALHWLDNYN